MNPHHSHTHFLHNHNHNHNHRARYAPLPSHHHQQNPNHLPPPLPPPPPPPPRVPQHPLTMPNPPPPPPPQQSQFPFNFSHRPIEEERQIATNHHHHHHHLEHPYANSPRLSSSRIIPDEPLPRRALPNFDREAAWNPNPRLVSDNRPLRNYPPSEFDRELHPCPVDRAVAPPYAAAIDSLRRDLEGGNSRLRVERVNAYEGNPRDRDEFVWGRGGDGNYHRSRDYASNFDASEAGFGVASGQSMRAIDMDSRPGGYVDVYGGECEGDMSRVVRRYGHCEGKRWVSERKGPREMHDSSFEFGNNGIGAAGNGEDFRAVSGKREYYGSEPGRYNSRGNNRDFAHEFNRTPPKKQIQKKSALLRIQTVKPNYRNRESEQLRYTGYAADCNSNFFRGKEQHGYLGHGMKAEEREGSPVELDISFESNSLVAKAIVAPSSSAVVSDTNVTTVSDADLTSAEKRRKVLVSESDCSGLQLAKLSSGAVGLNSSPFKANDTSSSVKDLNLEKNVSDTCSLPCTSVTDNPPDKNEVALLDRNTKICSGKSSPRVVKKKKIVKRVVKKVLANPSSTVSSSLSANTVPGTVQTDSVPLSSSNSSGLDKIETSLKDKGTTVDKVSMTDCLLSLPNKANLFPKDKMEDLSLLSLGPHFRSQEYKIDEDPDFGKVDSFERSGGDISNSPSCASSNEDKQSGSDCLDANNSAHDFLSMPNTDRVNKSLNGGTSSAGNQMDYENKQFCQNEMSLSPGKYSNIGSPQNRYLLDVGDGKNGRLFSSADNIINTDLINTCDYGLNSNGLTGSEENFAVSGNDNIVIVGKANSEIKSPTVTQFAISEENPDVTVAVPSSRMVAISSSEKTRIQDGPDCRQHTSVLKQVCDNGLSNLEDSITVHCCGIMNDAGKQLPPSEATTSPENCNTEETLSNFNNPDEFGEGGTNMIKNRESGLMKDPCPSVVLDQSNQSLDLNSQSSIDGDTTLYGKIKVSKAEFYVGNNDDNDANKVSPVSKRIKVTASHPNFTKCQSEFSDATVVTVSCAEFPISVSDNQAHQKAIALSSMGMLPSAPSIPCSVDTAKFSDNILLGGPFESMDTTRETMSSESLEWQPSAIASYSLCEELAIPNVQFSSFEGEQEENITPPVSVANTQTDNLVTGNVKGEKSDLQAVEENYRYIDIAQRSPSVDMVSNLCIKDGLLPKNHMSCPVNVDGVTHSNSNDELIEDAPDALSDMCSQGMASEEPDRRILDCTAVHSESIRGDEENPDSLSVVEHDSDLPSSPIQHITTIIKSDHGTSISKPIMRRIIPQPLQVYSEVMTQSLSSYCLESNGSKNQPGDVIPKTFQGHSFTFSKSKTKISASSTHASKPRTWHRTSNNSTISLPGIKHSVGTVPPKRSMQESRGNFRSTSYVRKGNSLLRKPVPVSALPQIPSSIHSPSFSLDELPKSIRSESRVDVVDQPILKTGLKNASQKRQRTTPMPIDTKSEENMSLPLVEPPSSGRENATEPRKLIESEDAPNTFENMLKHYEIPDIQTGSSNNGESPVEVNGGNISSVNTKRIVYMKPKTNQLVATSSSCDASVAADDKAQTAFSDGYYKRSKNQLVRTTFENHINQTVAMPNSAINSDGQGASKGLCNRRFSKRLSLKVAGSSCKPLRASLVWTLRGKTASKNNSHSWHYQKVLPQLFPWKRTTYLRSFIHNSASSSNISSLSAVSKKLLLLRKRNTIYTRSSHGFSLWKSKVLGVGGHSLKWSKSMEKRSKQANEEATRAVAAAERKKREQKDAASHGSPTKRKRIFRIGSVRYKMDPSRHTLQRISDDESLSSSSIHSGLAAKGAYIPRRLVIGNDEYVRIGNGNQLIRDPKKRTRILANEKVRWSLHTARQRLARKQKYCQFFTRFGKCNKDGGKCPYIHDPSKIAVCTKFLNGLCSTPNCKLTHKVIPERMPDCSYYLQGLCSNRNCPYRHVNVNPRASICEGFLKGYCADGNECRKKHSYVCPTFEATGTCTQGAKCKLHHPKKQSKGKKRKRSGDQNNSRGRYFGSIPIDASEPAIMVAPRQCQQSDSLEGELSDYISLDVDEEVQEIVDHSFEQPTLCDMDSLDLQLGNFDELIKPLRIMKIKFTPESSQSSSLQL